MTPRDEIAHQALSLSPEDRVYVANLIDESLVEGDFATPDIRAAWIDEIKRRIAAYDRGELQAIPGAQSLLEMRRALEDFRARRASS